MKKWSVLLEYGTGAPWRCEIEASNLRTALYRAGVQVSEGGVRLGVPLGRHLLPSKGLEVRVTVQRLT